MENQKNPEQAFWKNEKVLIILAFLPVFFLWLPIFSLNRKNPNIQRASLLSCLSTLYFFSFLFLALLFQMLPFIGSYISPILHLFGLLIYLGLNIFFIYSELRSKKIAIGILERQYAFLESLVQLRP